MKNKVIITLILAVIGGIVFNVMKNKEYVRLGTKLAEERELRHDLLKEEYFPAWACGTYKNNSRINVASIYADIVTAYTNQDLLAMRYAISKLPVNRNQHQWQAVSAVESEFLRILNDSFLRINTLHDFKTVDEFERYVRIGVEAARFYGESEIYRKSYEFPIGVECLTFKVLNDYRQKFLDDGRNDLKDVAERYLKYWIVKIESPDGLTRQCAWYALKYNTVFVKELKPEKALTAEQGIQVARQTAIGLVRCGYRPNWVDMDFPLPAGKADPLSSIRFHSWDAKK